MKPRPYTYSKLQALFASGTDPMPKDLQQNKMTRVLSALNSIEKADKPTVEDWRLMTDVVNLMESLVEMGHVHDADGLIRDCVNALAESAKRSKKTGVIRLDGQGIKSLRGVIEDYALVISVLPHRVMVECHRRTEKRILDIRMGKHRPEDVEVIDLE